MDAIETSGLSSENNVSPENTQDKANYALQLTTDFFQRQIQSLPQFSAAVPLPLSCQPMKTEAGLPHPIEALTTECESHTTRAHDNEALASESVDDDRDPFIIDKCKKTRDS